MRYFILALILTLGFIVMISCEQNRANNSESNREILTDNEAPLLLDDEPLLLDDEPLLLEDNPVGSPSGPMADNSRCHVCHINYVNEDIAVVHARNGIGCADCHGQSDSHIDDESWAWGGNGTAPEIMYLPEKINPFCMGCHTKDKIDTKEHKDVLAGKDPEHKYCTDCHGEHRLVRRRCKWK